jgi:hypothetical protein
MVPGRAEEKRDGFITLVDAVRGQRSVTIGSVRSHDESSAAVDITIGEQPDAQGMTLMMVRAQGEWKIIQVVR